jgi:hypothetical protein
VGRTYIVKHGKDGKTVKDLLGSMDGDGICALAELKAAARVMLADPWGRDRASIGLLASQINTWRGGGKPPSTGRQSTFTPATSETNYSVVARDFGQGGKA